MAGGTKGKSSLVVDVCMGSFYPSVSHYLIKVEFRMLSAVVVAMLLSEGGDLYRVGIQFQGKISKGFPCLNKKKMKKSVCVCYGPHAEADRGSKIQKINLSQLSS